ncbi:MAG: beta-galactosidase [Tenuifilaceae bacterium]|jgi:beta-galactosidase|nr:beta-galactosidase [Tenuifilaceae bacterium]
MKILLKNTAGFLILFAFLLGSCTEQPTHTFRIADGHFLIDEKPTQFFSGEIHPSRIPREYWQDRLRMVRAMGMNAISIYMFWNVHEPYPGQYNFKGNADIAHFIRLAHKEGLWVMLRPSPYVCAEWEFGGYPWWLLKEKDLKVRSKDPKFIEAYRKYVLEIGQHLAPLQIQNDGPIIMVQIENEYGFYGNDKEYLAINRDIFREAGFTCELFTCDPPSTIDAGHLPGVYAAVNGGISPREVIATQNRINGGGPYFVSEWYPAWFDVWGKKHHTSSVEHFTQYLDSIFHYGISLNMYMAHGGSNFGFMNGANYDTYMPYQSQTQSYDYDAPINEAGNPTPKFYAYRGLVEKYAPTDYVIPEIPEPKRSISIAPISLNLVSFVENQRPEVIKSDHPLSFEDINQGYGYVLYETNLPSGKGWLKIKELRDYGIVLLNNQRMGILDRRSQLDSIYLDVSADGAKLSLFIENLGRINFGQFLADNRKGITQAVYFKGEEVKDWEIFGYPFSNINGFKFQEVKGGEEGEEEVDRLYQWPILRKGIFILNEVADTYLDVSNFGKGSLWVNGHHIGRYWHIGPQQTLYIPAPWLKKGENEVVVLEMHKTWQNQIRGIDNPILDVLNEELFTGTTSVQQIIY